MSIVAGSPANAGKHLNAFSVDVEDYFQVEAFSGVVSRDSWPSFESRVVANTSRMLDLVDRYRIRGTFFVLGWVAERFPGLVREIRDRGHELGCHSYWHRLIYRLTPQEFADDTKRAKAAIEDAAQLEVKAYRAPTFSITAQSLWALDVLADCGFSIDSSIYPVRHDRYGIVGSPRDPYSIACGKSAEGLIEFPISTFRLFGHDLPVAGGGYLRMLPLWYNRHGLRRIHDESRAAMVYVHPWEIDPAQPRIRSRLRSRLRHYTNLGAMQSRLEYFFERYAFAAIGDVLSGRRLARYRIDRERNTLTPVAAQSESA